MSHKLATVRPRAEEQQKDRGTIIQAILTAVLGLAALLPCGSVLAADRLEGQATVLVGPSSGKLWAVGVEMPLSGGKAWTARGGGLSYEYRDGDYWEDGSGSVFGVGFRFYGGHESQGTYFGVNLDYVSVDVDWGGYGYYGYTKISGLVPGLAAGYKAVFGNGFTVEPNIYVGALSVAGGDNLETSVIGGIGITLGKRF